MRAYNEHPTTALTAVTHARMHGGMVGVPCALTATTATVIRTSSLENIVLFFFG